MAISPLAHPPGLFISYSPPPSCHQDRHLKVSFTVFIAKPCSVAFKIVSKGFYSEIDITNVKLIWKSKGLIVA